VVQQRSFISCMAGMMTVLAQQGATLAAAVLVRGARDVFGVGARGCRARRGALLRGAHADGAGLQRPQVRPVRPPPHSKPIHLLACAHTARLLKCICASPYHGFWSSGAELSL
jgi:hypothetical protein